MKITILFFGMSKDLSGERKISIQLLKERTVEDIRNLLLKKYPSFSSMDSFAIAVNESYAEDQTKINDNDIIAVIPPVSGG